MRVLVTGGAGYIGSHTVRQLTLRGDQVVVLDSLELGHRQAIGQTPLVVGNTRDRALCLKTLREHRIEAVVHFAAYKAVGESITAPGKYFENNVYGTQQLLEAMKEAQVRHFVFSSTAAVYGTPEVLPVAESARLNPESPYGESKLLVEQMLKWYDSAHGVTSVALRYFNAAGAVMDGSIGEDPRQAQNLVPRVMLVATARAPALKVFGTDYPTPDGTCVRDYIHVEDLASAHLAALDYLRASGSSDVFNLGTGQGASVKQVLEAARRSSQVEIAVEYVGRRAGDPAAVWADNTKAKARLNWAPRYGLEEIVSSAWKWHSSHPDGYA